MNKITGRNERMAALEKWASQKKAALKKWASQKKSKK
tara:strand:- start:1409 stop:1519 length:111 start_codon:yes stop_codon:yes gene_type:complete